MWLISKCLDRAVQHKPHIRPKPMKTFCQHCNKIFQVKQFGHLDRCLLFFFYILSQVYLKLGLSKGIQKQGQFTLLWILLPQCLYLFLASKCYILCYAFFFLITWRFFFSFVLNPVGWYHVHATKQFICMTSVQFLQGVQYFEDNDQVWKTSNQC